MAANPAATLASTIQSTSINRHPSPHHDINPSTAASKKVPAEIDTQTAEDHDDEDDDLSLHSSIVSPSATIHPRPRRAQFPPLPDMRFEQSYLASLKNANTTSEVLYITMRDQVILPLAQGTLWNLLLFGWRHWNRGTKFAGRGLGSKIRRWWWQVNNWEMPKEKEIQRQGFAKEIKEVSESWAEKFETFLSGKKRLG